MLTTAPSTLSAEGVLCFTCPRSWNEMSQEQLRYALHLIGCGMYSPLEVRTLLLLRFCGIVPVRNTPNGWSCYAPLCYRAGRKKPHRHHFFLQSWQVQDMTGQLEYVDSYEAFDVRLESIGGFKAVDGLLHGVRFWDYLQMEKYYQGYLATKEEKYALGLARLLYPETAASPQHSIQLMSLDDAELTGCIMWFSYVKKQLSVFFRHFFKPVPQNGKVVNWIEQMNAQLRALTDGDITKEQAVYDKDCWRALTELDAKARDAEEFKRRCASK